jgi:hypothetical protein
LFDTARLINAALLAKIHTVEWSTAILPNPTSVTALRGNWWGVEGETLTDSIGRVGHVDLISGIPGSDTNHHVAPYSMTEEFVSVYRMHPLMPDEFNFHSAISHGRWSPGSRHRTSPTQTTNRWHYRCVQPLHRRLARLVYVAR